MSEQLPMPTRGPVVSVHGDDETLATVNIEYKEPIAELKGRGPGHLAEENANADLIAAAINSAEACRVMGYDPIGCIQALPKVLDVVSLTTERLENMLDVGGNFDYDDLRTLRAALAATHTRRGTP